MHSSYLHLLTISTYVLSCLLVYFLQRRGVYLSAKHNPSIITRRMYYVVFPTIPTLELLGTQLPGKLFSPSYICKNCPTTFYCIFQSVWVPMTTTQNIRVYFLSFKKHFFIMVPTLNSFKKFFIQSVF